MWFPAASPARYLADVFLLLVAVETAVWSLMSEFVTEQDHPREIPLNFCLKQSVSSLLLCRTFLNLPYVGQFLVDALLFQLSRSSIS